MEARQDLGGRFRAEGNLRRGKAPFEEGVGKGDGVLDAFANAEEALVAARDLAAQSRDPATIVEMVTQRVSELTTSDDLTVIAVRRETV